MGIPANPAHCPSPVIPSLGTFDNVMRVSSIANIVTCVPWKYCCSTVNGNPGLTIALRSLLQFAHSLSPLIARGDFSTVSKDFDARLAHGAHTNSAKRITPANNRQQAPVKISIKRSVIRSPSHP